MVSVDLYVPKIFISASLFIVDHNTHDYCTVMLHFALILFKHCCTKVFIESQIFKKHNSYVLI